MAPIARRALVWLPPELVCFATVVIPTCAACLCDESALALLYAALLVPLYSEMRSPSHSGSSASAGRLPALTQLRGAMALQVAFCILAVDFPLFPRAAAKTLTFGRSVMDLGVGATVLSGALTRRRPGSHGEDGSRVSAARVLVRHSPLLLAGAGRLLALRATNYHEVHSEYGLHWNFFFSLAVVDIASRLLEPRSAAACGVCALVLLVCHQLALLSGLTHYVQHAPRTSFVSANKEGLISLPGYLALALAGSAASAPLLSTPGVGARSLLLLAAALWAAAAVADALVQSTSRRLCNAAYVLWVMAQVCLVTSLAMLRGRRASSVRRSPRVHGDGDSDDTPPPLLDALNRHPLSVFLLANLLTGGVNLSVDTMGASHGFAAAVLTAYMAIVCAAAVALERRRRKAHS